MKYVLSDYSSDDDYLSEESFSKDVESKRHHDSVNTKSTGLSSGETFSDFKKSVAEVIPKRKLNPLEKSNLK